MALARLSNVSTRVSHTAAFSPEAREMATTRTDCKGKPLVKTSVYEADSEESRQKVAHGDEKDFAVAAGGWMRSSGVARAMPPHTNV